MIPQFETLKTDDRVYLVQSAWNEITIADIAHRSMEFEVNRGILSAFIIYHLLKIFSNIQ
jgi:hypothetical protein